MLSLLIMFQQPPPSSDLASTYRELYRARFRAGVQAGTTTPFVLPLHLLAYWVVPTLYLAIPHKNRPWLYRARWLVLAFICAFNGYIIKHVGSLNFSFSYGAGFVAAWATIWNFTLLVWTRPQWDAKRVERRRITTPLSDRTAPESQLNGSTDVTKTKGVLPNGNGKVNGVRKRETHAKQCAVAVEGTESMKSAEAGPIEEKCLARGIVAQNDHDENLQLKQNSASGLGRLTWEHEYEYYWQAYPADACFKTRLGWAFDIVSSLRLTGWNWAPSCLPPYEPPPKIGPYQLPLEYGSHRSKQGYERTLSRRKFILSRLLFHVIPCYIIVDFCATVMTMDPYFVVGPEHNYPLPTHLASLHPVLLSLQRTVLGFIAVVSALHYAWNTGALCLAIYFPPILGFRAHPWHLPSMTGSFVEVLDRGLFGFWGSWWHQTFRVGFSAPTKWLLRHGCLPLPHSKYEGVGRIITPLVGVIIAFAQSGLIHGAGSYSSVPVTHYWGPLLFFSLAGIGTILQSMLSSLLVRRIEKPPRWVRRLGNIVFVFLWLWATSGQLLDDFGRSGIWLWEPVPISLARAAGLGDDRRIWRYDRDSLPRWQWGPHGRWWETGISI
ncbi:hypothetical protein F4859DRAFT_469641 [Xylaria cf. heliscus]|nr:hypothetical protein F4859DRAFT_469641 [Xylaria cf. heliscus]